MDLLSTIWRPVVEIVIFWYVIYRFLLFIQGTRTVQLLIGLLFLMLVSVLSQWFGFFSINWVLTNFFAIGVLALVVIFQPELRRALARLGQNAAFTSMIKRGGMIDEIVKASGILAKKKVGALVAIERDIGLRNYIESGIRLDAVVNSDLLTTIFNPSVSFHDGGVIISNNRIASCASLFPLSQNADISKTLGTRHRAAVGLTEETDAICIVVSEETGAITVSVYGKMTRNLDADGLKRVLMSLLRPDETRRSIFDIWRSKHGRQSETE
ncbi:MAG: diadenylate cyclase CdaA [Candidatus Omnitrophica bacterium]|nr:diadenylate cyclase CdaA [Candidatus Omnitrophota bacterium]